MSDYISAADEQKAQQASERATRLREFIGQWELEDTVPEATLHCAGGWLL